MASSNAERKSSGTWEARRSSTKLLVGVAVVAHHHRSCASDSFSSFFSSPPPSHHHHPPPSTLRFGLQSIQYRPSNSQRSKQLKVSVPLSHAHTALDHNPYVSQHCNIILTSGSFDQTPSSSSSSSDHSYIISPVPQYFVSVATPNHPPSSSDIAHFIFRTFLS